MQKRASRHRNRADDIFDKIVIARGSIIIGRCDVGMANASETLPRNLRIRATRSEQRAPVNDNASNVASIAPSARRL